ncbi:MAG TPA: hypothetical protein VIT64_13745, partial [Ilumatobacteraceae bacterium]
MRERTLLTSAAALAAIGLLSLFLAYQHEPSAAESDPASAVSTIAPTSESTAESTSTSPATTTVPETSSTSDPSITTAPIATTPTTTTPTTTAPTTTAPTTTTPSTTVPEVPTTVGQQCSLAAYLAYSPTSIADDTPPPGTAPDELCVPVSALRPDETIVGAFLT